MRGASVSVELPCEMGFWKDKRENRISSKFKSRNGSMARLHRGPNWKVGPF